MPRVLVAVDGIRGNSANQATLAVLRRASMHDGAGAAAGGLGKELFGGAAPHVYPAGFGGGFYQEMHVCQTDRGRLMCATPRVGFTQLLQPYAVWKERMLPARGFEFVITKSAILR